MSSMRQRCIPLGGRYRQVSLYFAELNHWQRDSATTAQVPVQRTCRIYHMKQANNDDITTTTATPKEAVRILWDGLWDDKSSDYNG